MKRILTVQDLSCMGKCALTVALPVISAMGVETCVLPTALLSVHTAFPSFTFQDLSDMIGPIIAHWKREGMRFDSIYTGYLGSLHQLAQISALIDDFRRDDTLIFIDPVMGDHGKLYAGLPAAFAPQMAKLCQKAQVITPNMTEACLLLGRPYPDDAYNETDVQNILRALAALGASKIILTGVSLVKGQLGVYGYDAAQDSFFSHMHPQRAGRFHGTGDTFASACVGAMTRGLDFQTAVCLALDFTFESIECSLRSADHPWYGTQFEEAIPYLLGRLSALAKA